MMRREGGLECPICWEPFNVVENVPYVMWCGHTICTYCLVGLRRATVKFPPLPFQLPFFVACPWCNLLSFRLVHHGIIRFPSKNYYLLWIVESMNGHRSKSRRGKKSKDSNRRCEAGDRNPDQGGWQWMIEIFSRRRLHGSMRKSMAMIHRLLAKIPLVVVCLMMALCAIHMSAAVLGLCCIFLTFALAFSSFLVMYLSLNWLIREITS